MKEKIENFIMKFSYREIRRRKMQAFKWRLETLRLMEKEELEFEYVEQKGKCEHKKNVCEYYFAWNYNGCLERIF